MPSTVKPKHVRSGDVLSAKHINRISQAVLQRIHITGGRANHRVNTVGIAIDTRSVLPGGPVSFDGLITGSAAITGHTARWVYTVHRISFEGVTPPNPDNVPGFKKVQTVLPGGGSTDAPPVLAFNAVELSHAAEPAAEEPWYVWGVDAHGDDYPAGFSPKPIGGGGTTNTHKVDTPVRIYVGTHSDIDYYYFYEVGSHDGTCG